MLRPLIDFLLRSYAPPTASMPLPARKPTQLGKGDEGEGVRHEAGAPDLPRYGRPAGVCVRVHAYGLSYEAQAVVVCQDRAELVQATWLAKRIARDMHDAPSAGRWFLGRSPTTTTKILRRFAAPCGSRSGSSGTLPRAA